jgi:hypothetical protein
MLDHRLIAAASVAVNLFPRHDFIVAEWTVFDAHRTIICGVPKCNATRFRALFHLTQKSGKGYLQMSSRSFTAAVIASER